MPAKKTLKKTTTPPASHSAPTKTQAAKSAQLKSVTSSSTKNNRVKNKKKQTAFEKAAAAQVKAISDPSLFRMAINFQSVGDPGRVFKAVGHFIDAFQLIDQALADVIGVKFKESLQLNNTPIDGFTYEFRNCADTLQDEDLRSEANKKNICQFFVDAKFNVIRWCANSGETPSQKSIDKLEKQIVKLAKDAQLNEIPAYQAPNRGKFLKGINTFLKASSKLLGNDQAFFVCHQGYASLAGEMEISEAVIKQVLVQKTIEQRNSAVLQVKRPDYLGNTKWLLKHQGYSIDVVVLDKNWLDKFQRKEVNVQPGDALKGVLLQHISFGYDMEIASIRYELEEVHEVVPAPDDTQLGMEF